jgi:hypothetical protein
MKIYRDYFEPFQSFKNFKFVVAEIMKSQETFIFIGSDRKAASELVDFAFRPGISQVYALSTFSEEAYL